LGDEAVVVNGTADDAAVTQIVMRRGNVEFVITAQGSDTHFLTASDGSGVYPVTRPLGSSVVQNVAVSSGRQLVGLLPAQPG
jgi:hypothetical protein